MLEGLAIIVGAGPGLGRSLARRFGREGLDLVVVPRADVDPEAFRRDLAMEGSTVHVRPCDAGDAPGLAKVLDGILALDQPVEVLLYNASGAQEGAPSTLDPERLHRDLETSALGALRCVQAVLPGMRDRGRGTVLFTGGGSALHPKAAQAGQALGKGLLRTLALLLAEELEPAGIHVATLTIAGFIQAGGPLDPDRLADLFWQLHREAPPAWSRERVLP